MGHTGPIDSVTSVAAISQGMRPLINWEPSGPWYSGGPVDGYTWSRRERPQSVHNPKGANGWRAPSAYYFYHQTNIAPKVRIKTRDSFWYGTEYDSAHPGWVTPIPDVWPVPGSVSNMALIKARNDLRKNNAQLGVALLERMKTSNMVFGAMVDITNTIKSFKRIHPKSLVAEVWRKQGRGNWYRQLSRRAKPVADRWLEVQYGWLPTMMDINESSNALARLESGYDDGAFKVSSKKTHVDNYSSGDQGKDWPFSANGNWRCKTTESLKRGATVRLDYAIECPHTVALSELGLLNPLSIVWEIVPWSFVVDWAWPIGPWAESLDATAGMSFIGGSLTEWVQYTRSAHSPYDAGPRPEQSRLTLERQGFQFVKRMKRSVYGSSPVPYPPLPGQGQFLNAGKRAQNALALLTSALGRR